MCTETYSLPLRLYSHAISSSMLTTKPGLFLLSNSFRTASILSAKSFPEYFSSSTITGLLGLAGFSVPQTLSMRFVGTASKPAPPFALIFAPSPPACSTQVGQGVSRCKQDKTTEPRTLGGQY